jgi:ankyrin repeat protein
VNTTLLNGTTNPMCRAGYLGHTNVISLLLKYGGDINLRSSDGRTALMWSAFRNNGKMCSFLLDHGADITLEDNQGWNALDIAIIKMNYESAIILKRRGL